MAEFNLLRLKAERVARGMKMEEMSRLMGFKYVNQYQKREAGKTPIKVDEFAKIMEIFSLDMGQSAIFFDSTYNHETNTRIRNNNRTHQQAE